MFPISHRRRIVSLVLGAAVAAVFALSGCVAHHHYPGGPGYYTAAAPPRSAANGYAYRYDDVVLVFDSSWNGYWVRSHPDHYFCSNQFYRRTGGGWQRARSMRGPWISVEVRSLPPRLHRHAAAKPRRDERRESALERRDTFFTAVKENRAERKEALEQRRDEQKQAFREGRDALRTAVKENRAERKEALGQRRDEQKQAVRERLEDRRELANAKREKRREIAESRQPRQTAKASAGTSRGAAQERGRKLRKDEDEEVPESHRAR